MSYTGAEGVWSRADPTAPSQVMTDVAGNPEEERRAEFYHQPWSQEAVSRYFYCKVWRGLCTSGSPTTLRETMPFTLWELSLLPDALLGWMRVVVGAILSLPSNTVTCSYSFKDPAAQAGAGAVAGGA